MSLLKILTIIILFSTAICSFVIMGYSLSIKSKLPKYASCTENCTIKNSDVDDIRSKIEKNVTISSILGSLLLLFVIFEVFQMRQTKQQTK